MRITRFSVWLFASLFPLLPITAVAEQTLEQEQTALSSRLQPLDALKERAMHVRQAAVSCYINLKKEHPQAWQSAECSSYRQLAENELADITGKLEQQALTLKNATDYSPLEREQADKLLNSANAFVHEIGVFTMKMQKEIKDTAE